MKAMLPVDLMTIIIAILMVFGIAIAYWYTVESDVSTTTAQNIEQISSGAAGLALFEPLIRKKSKTKGSKKHNSRGIVITTTLLATIVFFLVVAIVLFMILASLGGEAGPSSSSFFYGVFDSIISSLPWVS